MTRGMEIQKAGEISSALMENVAKVKYGEVSVSLRIHDGRVVDITHSTTQTIKDSDHVTKK